jgi:hypothetical protein
MAILAFQYPVFQPAMRIIATITNGLPTVVTTTFNHQYHSGIIVRLVIPEGFGMPEANGLQGSIIVTGDTTFEVAIDSREFSAFSYATTFPYNQEYPQVVPFGTLNSEWKLATKNVINPITGV